MGRSRAVGRWARVKGDKERERELADMACVPVECESGQKEKNRKRIARAQYLRINRTSKGLVDHASDSNLRAGLHRILG